jgi:SAM-dependent methyltransferase
MKKPVRTSLEVGFSGEELPANFAHLRGMAWRRIPLCKDFPFEDEQFDVVILHGDCVVQDIVKESHRVLKPEGRLFFTVNEKTKKQSGYTMRDLYSVVREGFNIIDVVRPPWWKFGRDGYTITICAQKKAWKVYRSFIRDGSLPFSPFQPRS